MTIHFEFRWRTEIRTPDGDHTAAEISGLSVIHRLVVVVVVLVLDHILDYGGVIVDRLAR